LKPLPPQQQDQRYQQTALSLAIQLNAAGPKMATFPLCRQLLDYFYGCADSLTLQYRLVALLKALFAFRLHRELALFRLRRRVCNLALREQPEHEALCRAIQEERQSWEAALLGKHHSSTAMVFVRAAEQAGLGLNEVARAFRTGQLKIRQGSLTMPHIRPVLLGTAAGFLAFLFPGLITYNLYTLQPGNLTFSLPMLVGSMLFSGWYGWQIYIGACTDKKLLARLESLYRKRLALS
jgi:hypothetical protein